MKKVAEKSYIPANKIMLDLIQQYGEKFKVAYSISGIALEQFEKYTPEVIQSFQQLARTGQVEFLSETYAHSLVSLKSTEAFKEQVLMHREKIEELFHQTPKVFRNTELIYSDEIGAMVADMGYEAMLTEGAKHILGWKSPNYIYANSINPKLKVLLRNFTLSDDIAFRFSQQSWSGWPLTAEKFTQWLKKLDEKDEVINLFMDYETFGEHQWKETGIFEFLRRLPEAVFKDSDIEFHSPSEIVEMLQPVSAIQVPFPISWADEERDLTAWLGNELQDEAFDKLYALESKINQCQDEKIRKDWFYLQNSDHFYYMCTKWFSDGDVHKYFNPYGGPYDAFINYMNVLSDFIMQVEKSCQSTSQPPVKTANNSDVAAKRPIATKKPDTFNDIKKVPKTVLKKALHLVPVETIAAALYHTDNEIKERIIMVMGKRALNEMEKIKIRNPSAEVKQQCRQDILDAIAEQYEV
jgi:alpha-amylase